jgi:hypothetical protein
MAAMVTIHGEPSTRRPSPRIPTIHDGHHAGDGHPLSQQTSTLHSKPDGSVSKHGLHGSKQGDGGSQSP